MQNMQKMASFKQARKEKGFTIIELVVVILLLGILAATALPRFMDVTDEAHTAVVDAVEGSLTTSAALFRAQWFAKGQPSGAVPEFGSAAYSAGASGYPALLGGATTSASCSALFSELLQAGGAPSIGAFEATGGESAGDETDVDGTGGGASISSLTVGPTVTNANLSVAANLGDGVDFVAVKSNGGGTVFCVNNAATDDCINGTYFASQALAQADIDGPNDGSTGVTLDVLLATFADAGGSCAFYYTGQFKDVGAGVLTGGYSADGDVLGLERLTYTLANGTMARTVVAFE